MKNSIKHLLLVLIAILGVVVVHSKSPASSERHTANGNESNVALAGFDAVSYHRDRAAKSGNGFYQIEHQGALYHVSSAENLAIFRQARARFLPEVAGCRAYGIGMGRSLPVDPTAYDIFEGKLYGILNKATMHNCQEDRAANIRSANKFGRI